MIVSEERQFTRDCIEEYLSNGGYEELCSFVSWRYRLNKSMAEDVTQDTFTKAWKDGNFRKESKFKSWLFGIAKNTISDHYKSSENKYFRSSIISSNEEGYVQIESKDNLEREVEKRDLAKKIYSSINKTFSELPKEQQEVFYLRHYENMKFSDIAKLLNVGVNTLKTRIRYTKEKLNLFLDEDISLRDYFETLYPDTGPVLVFYNQQ